MPRAGLARRLAALVYESLIVTACVFIASFALVPLVSPSATRAQGLSIPPLLGRIASLAILFALGALLFGWLWSEGRRTLPMQAWKLALVDLRERPLTKSRAIARYVAAWIGPLLAVATYALLAPFGLGALAWPVAGLNWLAALVDPERAFLHDRLAGTRIVMTSADVTVPPRPR
ncbi:MAG TPA: RDD family protein [Casimicrobiaceae bacterium]|nr:RDD family protein [Casimicrobiaceae bacterium]